MQHDSDKKQCQKIPNEFIIFARRSDLRFSSFEARYKVDVVLPINYLKNATGVDVNRKTGEIYWTDPGADVIKRASFDGKHVQTIVDSGISAADSLAVDSIGRKVNIVFYNISKKSTINCNCFFFLYSFTALLDRCGIE